MRRVYRILGGLAIVVVVILIMRWFAQPHQPSYQGKTLSVWLTNYVLLFDGNVHSETAETDVAVRAMGTNCLPILLQLLDATDPKVKQALNGLMQTKSPVHIDLGNTEAGRWKAVQAFRALGPIAKPAIPALAEMLMRGNAQAAYALAHTGVDAVGALTNALTGTNLLSRQVAIQTLGGFAQKTNTDTAAQTAIVSALVRCARDPDATVRGTAYNTVVQCRQSSGVAVPLLMELLSDKETTARAFAAGALCSFASEAKEAKTALLVAIHDSDKEVKRNAILALAYIGAVDESVRPAVLECLQDPDSEIRIWTAMSLGFPESFGKHAVPELVAALADKDRNMRTQAARSLTAIQSKDPAIVMALLMQNLHDQYSEPRVSAATALGSLGPKASEALPEILKLLDDPTWQVRQAAAAAVTKISPGNTNGLTVLVRMLEDANDDLAMEASSQLAQLGSLAKPAIPDLIKIIESKVRPEVRYNAMQALLKLDPQNPAALPALLKKLADPDPALRVEAADFLGWTGTNANDAVIRALEKASKDPEPDVREHAAAALKRINHDR